MLSTQVSLAEQHILLIDDNPNNLLLIELILQEHNIIHIYKSQNALDAYEMLANNPIDAILLDVMMPDIDGIQACKTIRENKSYDSIPIIMVTANDDNETFQKSFKAGADDFISKPINPVVLLARLTSQLEKHQMYQTLISQSRFSAMDEIISMLAHQWRQPLGVINAITNTIRAKMDLETASKNDFRESFDRIEHHLSELSQLITNFKTSFGSQESVTCLNIKNSVEEVLNFNKEKLIKLNIKHELVCSHMEHKKLSKQALVQVVTHLINNAIDALKECSQENPLMTISIEEKNKDLSITITDNGTGIDESVMPFIFDPYYSTKLERNGKGLGLYFAKQLVSQQLNGKLSITSKGKETTACVLLKNIQSC